MWLRISEDKGASPSDNSLVSSTLFSVSWSGGQSLLTVFPATPIPCGAGETMTIVGAGAGDNTHNRDLSRRTRDP